MNKTQINYVRDRVKSVAMCICGKIGSEINEKRPNIPEAPEKNYTIEELKKELLNKTACCYNLPDNFYNIVGNVMCTKDYKKQYDIFCKERDKLIKEDEKLLQEQEYREQQVHLEAKRITDKLVLGLEPMENLPDILDEFAATKF